MVGRILAALGVVLLVLWCAIICWSLQKVGLSSLIGPLVLAFFGLVIAFLGSCVIIGTAFSQDSTQGLLVLFVPGYFLFYGIKNAQGGLGAWVAGMVIWAGVRFTLLAGPPNGVVADNRFAAGGPNNRFAASAPDNRFAAGGPVEPQRAAPFQRAVPSFPRPRHFPTPQPRPVPNFPAPNNPVPNFAPPNFPVPRPAAPATPSVAGTPGRRAFPQPPGFRFNRRNGQNVLPGIPQPGDPTNQPPSKTFRDYIADNYSAWIGDDARLVREMKWLPAAKRPALGIRWGIGVDMPSTTPRKMIGKAEELTLLTGPAGPQLFGALVQRIDGKLCGKWSDMPSLAMPKVPVFTDQSEEQLIDDAARMNLDALAMMSLSADRVGITRTPRVTMIVRLVDVGARKITWSSAPLNSQKMRATLGKPDDASVLLLKSILDKLDADYKLADLPVFSEAVVQQRADRLAAAAPTPEVMLRTLAELRYYQASKLLKLDDARRCYATLIDDKAAGLLAGTNSEARAHAVDEWFQSRTPLGADGSGGLK
jgi:hypothetical protein